MPKAPHIPDPGEYRAALRRVDKGARRRVLRAVNFGQRLEDPHEAALAVAAARWQRRFWRRMWVVGPLIAVLLRAGQGVQAMLADAFVATIVFVAMALVFLRQAHRAERSNQAVVDAAVDAATRRRQPKAKKKQAQRGKGTGKRRRR
jgi:hypothetical protein